MSYGCPILFNQVNWTVACWQQWANPMIIYKVGTYFIVHDAHFLWFLMCSCYWVIKMIIDQAINELLWKKSYKKSKNCNGVIPQLPLLLQIERCPNAEALSTLVSIYRDRRDRRHWCWGLEIWPQDLRQKTEDLQGETSSSSQREGKAEHARDWSDSALCLEGNEVW